MRRGMTVLAIAVLIASALIFPLQVFAQSSATGVALSSYSDCTSPAGLDISMATDGTVTREGGIVTTAAGATLMSFDQTTGFQNYTGTFMGYNFASPAWSVPAGTIVGLYAYIGSMPYTSANSIEWFIAYRCDTQEVVYSCYGAYGTCPQSAASIPTASADCPNPLPADFAVHSIPAGALAYFKPSSDAYTGFNLPPGTWYTGAVEDGFVEVWIACQANNVFVPADNVTG